MAEDRMAVLDMLRKATSDGNVDVLREGVRVLAEAIMEAEVSELTGAAKGERAPERRLTNRNGYRERRWDTRVGTIGRAIPKVRDGSYFPSLLEPRRRAERALLSVVQEAYVAGVSTGGFGRRSRPCSLSSSQAIHHWLPHGPPCGSPAIGGWTHAKDHMGHSRVDGPLDCLVRNLGVGPCFRHSWRGPGSSGSCPSEAPKLGAVRFLVYRLCRSRCDLARHAVVERMASPVPVRGVVSRHRPPRSEAQVSSFRFGSSRLLVGVLLERESSRIRA